MSNFSNIPVSVRWATQYLCGEDGSEGICRNAHDEAIIDWCRISSTNACREERNAVSEVALRCASRNFVQVLKAQIQTELQVVVTDAQKTANGFWQINMQMRATGNSEKQGYFGTRARLMGNTLDAHWYKNRFVAGKNDNKKGVLSEHIAKGGGARYPSAVFKTAKPWEKEAINVVEARYELLRKRSAALSKIRRALAEYERLLNQCFPEP